MRSRILLGAIVVVGLFSAGSMASTGSHATPRQWSVVTFSDPVVLRGHVLMGEYLIVHDDARMEKGEPCTSIYRFDPAKGPQQLVLEFVCQPQQRTVCERTTFTVERDSVLGLNKVTDYQFAGDSELHGIPTK